MSLGDRLLAIHHSFEGAQLDHAFGGAIALAYWTEEPRGTRDIDVNVFLPPDECEQAFAALPSGVSYDDADIDRTKRDGQIRLWWGETPVDLFFSNLPIHGEAARHRRRVPFEGVEIPVLGPVELALFKAIFDRTRDWADIEDMLAAGTLDVDALRAHLTELAGDGDQRVARLAEAVRRASSGGHR
jgi:hypothetical protein